MFFCFLKNLGLLIFHFRIWNWFLGLKLHHSYRQLQKKKKGERYISLKWLAQLSDWLYVKTWKFSFSPYDLFGNIEMFSWIFFNCFLLPKIVTGSGHLKFVNWLCFLAVKYDHPLRDYQFNISRTALFSNTLVALPTGLGKTFIAAVVMYNYFRWFPEGNKTLDYSKLCISFT